MKKLRLVAVVAMLAIVTVASAQMNLGIKGGVNYSNIMGKDASDLYEAKIGFNAGLAADFNFAPEMAIQTGLFFTTKGANFKATNKASIDLMYLQMPIHFAYKVSVTPGTRVVLHAGPYVAYGVSGKAKYKDISVDVFKEYNFLGNSYSAIQRFDAGVGLGVGAEFGQFLVDIGWDMGLVKLNKNLDWKNMSAALSIGYKF
ncbi:MAG: hypothetical protein BWZ00_00905 [Bacteroidetes bacterium ADurb.BinA174]|nr:MAG: hypothetical protein BWZ00_00905 [Bacteroidetes bacterium ADurb.BinA174]